MTAPMRVFREAGGFDPSSALFNPHEPLGIEDLDELEGAVGPSGTAQRPTLPGGDASGAQTPAAPTVTPIVQATTEKRTVAATKPTQIRQEPVEPAPYVPPTPEELEPVVQAVPSLGPIIAEAVRSPMPDSLAQRGARVIVLIDVDGRGVVLG